ncbi:rhamnose ABC transporter substrate-binding protein [Thalassospira sp. MCCC 1A01428]|uniref:rhamnose ABC transporter substrate-binding protein n=1 Tax=Thalassospira sp. MCCC 1A01428 TaxID=1470575 RepID=UPI000A200F81|nr:rhamnose ABC transporter substrate-binding protein [Thalassospira sp. MCCC 1A01428]OSQ43109.1 ABC transporter substrate-binding protein [Thalassospira sp. MCCC 1A01428]
MKFRKSLLAAAALVFGLATVSAQAADNIRVGLVVKSLGNGFFEAARDGAMEAAKEVGNAEVIYTGPTSTTAEGQIESINALMAQHVDAIAVSANDPNALAPILKRAMQRGIKVISWDSGVAQDARIVHLNPSNNELIGKTCVKLAADVVGDGGGDIAILSATPTSTNQNIWIGEMKKALPDYSGLKLVDTVYGDDLADKSYRETVALLKKYPDLKAIVAPTSVGIVAAAQAVEDQNMVGKVFVTGLGLPSELAGHVEKGSVKSFAIWNPIDLGYSAMMISYKLATGAQGGPNSKIEAGRMGTISFDENGDGAMSEPFVYDASNVEKFAKIF